MSDSKTEISDGEKNCECAPIFMWEVEFDVHLTRNNGETESGGSTSHILAFTADEAVETAHEALKTIESRHNASKLNVFLKAVVCIEQISSISASVLESLGGAKIETMMLKADTNPKMN